MGNIKLPPLNLSILQFNDGNISTRMTHGIFNYQLLIRTYKERQFEITILGAFPQLTGEFISVAEKWGMAYNGSGLGAVLWRSLRQQRVKPQNKSDTPENIFIIKLRIKKLMLKYFLTTVTELRQIQCWKNVAQK